MTSPRPRPHPVSYRLPPDLVEALRAESARTGVPASRIVSDALRERLDGGDDDPGAVAARIAALSARLEVMLRDR